MPEPKYKEKEKARQLRREGQSVKEIARNLQVSPGSVSAWVRDIELTSDQKDVLHQRQREHAINLQRVGEDGQPYSEINRRNALKQRQIYQQEGRTHARSGDVLHEMACMLYWAEGAKHRNRVVFVNSDPNMMSLFMRFLRECLHLPDEKIKLRLHCYAKDVTEQETIKRYWLDLLNLKADCFSHVTVMAGSDTRYSRHHNGICTIDIGSTQLAMHLYGAIQEYIGIDKPEWLFERGVTN